MASEREESRLAPVQEAASTFAVCQQAGFQQCVNPMGAGNDDWGHCSLNIETVRAILTCFIGLSQHVTFQILP